MVITINQGLQSTLDNLALANSTTAELYVEETINSHLLACKRNELASKVSTKEIDELETIATTISGLASEQPVEEPPIEE